MRGQEEECYVEESGGVDFFMVIGAVTVVGDTVA